jgi:hypothetical protein
VENFGGAVEAVLDRFGDAGYERILIAAMTDEAGNDLRNPAVLRRVIERMRRHEVTFYVFGYESAFCAEKMTIGLKLDPDRTPRELRTDTVRFEGHTIRDWIDAGPESPRPELWWCSNPRRWRHWGGGLDGIPSGFGMYALNRMVLATGGTYFAMRMESDYDRKKLYPHYKPDRCSPLEYDRRMQKNRLRGTLEETWSHMADLYLPCDLVSDKAVARSVNSARRGHIYCSQQAEALQALINESNLRTPNRMRWIAHAEVTRAELLRLRFLLRQYYLTLREVHADHGGNLREREKIISIRRVLSPMI